MVFSSLPFLFVFMPLLFGVYYLVPARCRNIVLLLGSLSFYLVGTWKTPAHFLLFLLSMTADYALGRGMEARPARKKVFLWSGILLHLACLSLFKYVPFLTRELHRLLPAVPVLRLLLPIGISFYTFQGISYLADVYRGKIRAEKSALRFFVYLSMFEQLIAGPIVTYPQIAEELRAERRIPFQKAWEGLGIFIFGMGLKVLLANPVGRLWTDVQTIGYDSISTPLAWMALLAFTFQIYFDFFGYSLMAVGLGEMLGFHLPKNFDFPYLSVSMTEFWRRWHMTLGSWFREYVYIPLGGNRKGSVRTVCHLLVVWLLTGIWHGAGYNFLLWGLFLFAVIVLEKYAIGGFLERHRWLGHLYMFFLIPLSWALFAIGDIGQLGVFFTRLFPFFGQGMWSVFRYDYRKYFLLYYPFLVAGGIFSTRWPFRLLEKIRKMPWLVWTLLLAILGGSVYCMYRGLNDPFLYFRF